MQMMLCYPFPRRHLGSWLLEAMPMIWVINAVVGLSLGKDLAETTLLVTVPSLSFQYEVVINSIISKHLSF